MINKKSVEPQYQIEIDEYNKFGSVELGIMASHIWRDDPKHLLHLLARYKFCAKMLDGKSNVLEVGCANGFAIPIVLQNVDFVHGIDFDPVFIDNAKYINKDTNISYQTLDITKSKPDDIYDAVYSIDVLEHIKTEDEDKFMQNICSVLKPEGVCIIGTPNICASNYAAPLSQQGHINLKGANTLKELLLKYFKNVFIFSMNDEMVHTGFYPMAHYLMSISTGLLND